MNKNRRLENILEKFKTGKDEIKLNNGDVMYITEGQMLSLVVEANTKIAILDKDKRNDVELSEEMETLLKAIPGQNKAVDLILGLFGGDSDE